MGHNQIFRRSRKRANGRVLLAILVEVALGSVAGIAGVASIAQADVLLDDTSAVFTGPAPVEQSFTPTAAQAGAVDVTVVDEALPALLTSVRVAVTEGGTVIKSMAKAGTLTFTAVAGKTYAIRVLGNPDPAHFSGSVIVSLTPGGTTTPLLLSFPAAFKIPNPGETLLNFDQPLAIPEAGDYTIAITDFAFPAALAPGSTAGFFLGSAFLGAVPFGTPTTFRNLVASSGVSGEYKLTILAQADATAAAGLFGLRVTGGPSANVVFPDSTNPSGVTALGSLPAPTNVGDPAGGPVTLQATDFQFPTPLAELGAVLSSGGQLVARQCIVGCATAGNRATGNAPPGTLQLWRAAAAGAKPGSYLIGVNAGSAALYTDSQSVSPGGTVASGGFSFPFTVPSAGTYTAQIIDFNFPSTLPTVQFSVAQNGSILKQSSTSGSINFDATPGPATLLVIAQGANGSAGLFGAEVLTTGTNPQSILDRTQAVGSAYATRTFSDATAGTYDATLLDAVWPAAFQMLWVAVTRDGKVVGKLFGGGTVQFDAIPGDYTATIIAMPSVAEQAGLYMLTVKSTVPSVTLSVDKSSIPSGQSVHLTWTANAATACTASGDWSGGEPVTGSGVAVGPLSKSSTFSLTCSGPGGTSMPASVSVVVTPSSSGGGAFGAGGLAALGALAALRARRRGARGAYKSY
jgi:hypothetical protein